MVRQWVLTRRTHYSTYISFSFTDSTRNLRTLTNKTLFLVGDVIRVSPSGSLTPMVSWFDDGVKTTLTADSLTLRLTPDHARRHWIILISAIGTTMVPSDGGPARQHHIVERAMTSHLVPQGTATTLAPSMS